jgi:hypothetical protein
MQFVIWVWGVIGLKFVNAGVWKGMHACRFEYLHDCFIEKCNCLHYDEEGFSLYEEWFLFFFFLKKWTFVLWNDEDCFEVNIFFS